MKYGGTRLLILLLAAAIAWQLGLLAERLTAQVQEAQALEQSIAAVRGDIADLNAQIDAANQPEAAGALLRRLGYIAPGDLVFFDGG